MVSQIARMLVIPCLAIACSAQETTPTKAEKFERARRLAASFQFQRFHRDAAKGFARLGPVVLPVVERALREGTDVEAHGALLSLVAFKGASDLIISQLDWVLTHRSGILRLFRGDAAVIGYLRGKVNSNSRAVDVLWSMIGGPMHLAAARALGTGRNNRPTLLQHLVQDLDSVDEKRVARAVQYLSTNLRYLRPAPPQVAKAIERLLDDERRSLDELKQLSKDRDRMTKLCAKQFLATYRDIKTTRRDNEVALEKAQQMDQEMLASSLVSMLDLDSLRNRAIAELAALGKPVIPVLEKLLVHQNPLLVDGAVRALSEMSPMDEKVLVLLREFLADKTKAVDARISSMQFLAQSMDTDPERFTAIGDRLDESEPVKLRIAAIRILAQAEKHRHDVINLFEDALRSKHLDVVEYVTTTLGMMSTKKDERIVMLLMRQLHSPHAKIQRAAIFALASKDANVHLERLRQKPGLDDSVKKALDIVGDGKVLAGFLIADYSDNRIIQIDLKGKELFSIEEIFGVWDVELLDNGNLLITEFSVSRVSEVTRENKVVWSFEDLKNPYDADRLPNGNTLIADTFGRRVIEVDRAGKVVWKYDTDIHPYDADRLPNGNTLIADTHDDRVIEVAPNGKIVWEVKNVPNVHDADRLPNGNTLLTIRMLNEVREVDRDGKTVSTLKNLSSPSDADRLPDGRTVVAENGFIRIFDRRGKETWRKTITWAVEVTPVWKHQLEAQERRKNK